MAERRGVERGPSPPTNQHHVWVPTNLLMQSVVCSDSSPCQPANQPTTSNINKGRVSPVTITTVTPQPCLRWQSRVKRMQHITSDLEQHAQ
ncbi:hypothetical protein Pcinc_039489 [Petrolisthes cinctipes]|uniref:Uncharacterized protein n=1 Tax=Petrolisthes cinctipes TaxID=88211 RepID=A0AAE1BNC0_PETCI|nr:hypothetical protein Pcinc_039489 [Petrolisthes cinctipes]